MRYLGVVGLAVLLAACGGGGDDGPAQAATHGIDYVVTGTGTSDVTLESPGVGTVQVAAAASGFVRSYTCKAGDFLYLSAQTNGPNTFSSSTVTIKKDGAVYKTNSSTGAFTIASASGTC